MKRLTRDVDADGNEICKVDGKETTKKEFYEAYYSMLDKTPVMVGNMVVGEVIATMNGDKVSWTYNMFDQETFEHCFYLKLAAEKEELDAKV